MAKKNVKTIKVNHRNLGTVSVKVDADMAPYFEERGLLIKLEHSRDVAPYVMVKPNSDYPIEYAARVVLDEQGLLDPSRNVSYLNKDHFDLTTNNLVQVDRPHP